LAEQGDAGDVDRRVPADGAGVLHDPRTSRSGHEVETTIGLMRTAVSGTP
jgi:hypothetical protein